MSGTSPEILPYHAIQHIDLVPELVGQFVYVIDNYNTNGFSVVIYKDKDIKFLFGDFSGRVLDPLSDCEFLTNIDVFMSTYLNKYVEFVQIANVPMIQVYISVGHDDMWLVDARTHYNKYVGPGMLRDVFSKFGLKIPNYIESGCFLTDDKIKELKGLNTKLIIKPSSFKIIARDDDVRPMYARI